MRNSNIQLTICNIVSIYSNNTVKYCSQQVKVVPYQFIESGYTTAYCSNIHTTHICRYMPITYNVYVYKHIYTLLFVNCIHQLLSQFHFKAYLTNLTEDSCIVILQTFFLLLYKARSENTRNTRLI